MGVLALLLAPLASLATGLYLGLMLCLAGSVAIIGGFANIGRLGALLVALLGLLSLFVGVGAIYNPFAGAVSLIWLIGAWLLVGGMFELVIAIGTRVGRAWLLAVAVCNIVLGGLIVSLKSAEAFLLLGYLVGISFVVRGVWSIIFVGRAHQFPQLSTQGAL